MFELLAVPFWFTFLHLHFAAAAAAAAAPRIATAIGA
jgi:hypothetical protein